MSQKNSLADQLVMFMRTSAEASEKIDTLPHEGDLRSQLGIMLEQQERAVSDALLLAQMTAHRLGRMAKALQAEKSEPA
jgi:hypothetical protein